MDYSRVQCDADYVVYFCGYYSFVVGLFEWWDCIVDTISHDAELNESVWLIPTWEAFERASE